MSAGQTTADGGALDAAIEALWAEAAPTFRERVDAIEDHIANVLLGAVDAAVKDGACNAAHKLAGTMGIFGMAAGSSIALELEQLLEDVAEPDAHQIERMSQIANDLRADVDERSLATEKRTSVGQSRKDIRIRLVGRDRSFLESLRWGCGQRGFDPEHVVALADAEPEPVDAAIVDAGSFEAPTAVIEESARAGVPVVVIADSAAFDRRREYLRAGAHTVVSETAGAAIILDLVENLTATEASGISVVALGIPGSERARMQDGFAMEGCFVQPLAAPHELGAIVDSAAPDVIIVGDGLADLDLVDSLSVIAADPLWSSSLVVAVTETWELAAAVARSALAAGADDVIAFDRSWPAVARRLRLRAHRSMNGDRRRFGSSSDRVRLTTRLASLRSECVEAGKPMSIVYFRTVDLRALNANGGYGAGDQLLRRVERFLRTFFRAGDVVGAWTGGGFVAGLAVDRDVANRRLSAAVDEMHQAGLSCAGAVASTPDDGADIDGLVAAAARRAAAGVRTTRQEPAADRRIVVVEDDEVVAGLVRQLLEAERYTVQVIADGPSAVPVLTSPDVFDEVGLVLLDITLPGLDGFGVLRAMQRANTLDRLPVVMLTARTLEDDVQAAMDLGAVDHVAKPFSPQVLLRRVERALALVRT